MARVSKYGHGRRSGPWFETALSRLLTMRVRGVSMRFDLVDLQLFIAVAEARSITNGAARVHLALASASARIKGLEEALGVSLLTRGRRGVELTPAGESLLDHARVVIHNVEAMRGDLAGLCPRREGHRSLARQHVGPFGISAEGAGRLPAPSTPTSRSTSRNAKAPISPAPSLTGSADLGLAAEHALPDNIERIPFSEDRLVLVAARGDELANRRQVDFGEVVERDFVGLISSIALHSPYQRTRRAARRAPAVSRAAEQFRCDRPDGRRRHRRRGHA